MGHSKGAFPGAACGLAAGCLLLCLGAAGGKEAGDGRSAAGAARAPHRVEVVARDLRVVWSMVFAPGGRIFFTERPGRVRLIENGRLRAEPVLVLADVDASGKLGAMGMALHPRFAGNRWLYLAYSYRSGGGGQRVRVVRYREVRGALSERTVIVEDIPAATNHAGCRIGFGPDGMLYVTTGDADRPELAQRLDSLAGKTLRLNADGTVPRDNPFVGRVGARPEVWSYGHRNAQGMDWQPGTGRMFQSEHGPTGGDEINVVGRGRNYGWPAVHHEMSRPEMESPLLVYVPTPSLGPGSATFYRGAAFPQFRGDLLVGCLRGECILRVRLDGGRVVGQERLLEKKYGRIREVAEAPDGTIYFSTSQHDPPEGRPRPGYDQILRMVPEK